MSKAINSPTGRLLRNSRLFSLPPPLPAAPVQNSTAGQFLRTSDTATQPYPTHQAISTPPSSRSRGDWGLKRPLPSRAIPSNVPHLRVKAIDTLEHITDFESAADHTQSLAKWQDMNIPLSMPPAVRNSMTNSNNLVRDRTSAFAEDLDNTTLHPHGSESSEFTAERALRERRRRSAESQQRWRTQGPYLLTMTEQEFDRYLQNLVREHKHEFRKFLEAVKIEKKRNHEQASMRDRAADPATFELELQHRSRLDKYELDDWIKELRDKHTNLNSELAQYVREFFDLPAFPAPKSSIGQYSSARSDAGPPSTHPSAGLSYLLTDAVINNHPLYGPQAQREPVQARVLRTQTANGSRDRTADVGVGGFVTTLNTTANNPRGTNFKSDSPKDQVVRLDLSLTGGNKAWVQPTSAYVDEAGRIRLRVTEADAQSIGVKTGQPVADEQTSSGSSGRQDQPLDRGVFSNFGKALPDERPRLQRVTTARDAENRAKAAENSQVIDQITNLSQGRS